MAARGFRNRIAGLVRFSYPSLNGFAKAPKSPEALRAQLYDPARLERRFRLFEALTLPSLLAQEDDDFRLLVLTGPDLPAAARERLEAGVARLRGAQVVALEPMQHYSATQQAFDRVLDDAASHLTSFRLDDDDALDTGYIARLRRLAAGVAPLVRGPVAISGNAGFFVEVGPDGRRPFDVVEKLPPGSGPALVAPMGGRLNIYRRNHRLLPQFFTTFSEAETPSFLRTVHVDNDSNPNASGVSDTLPPAEAARLIAAHFPFAADWLRDG